MANDSSPKRRRSALQVLGGHLVREGGNAPPPHTRNNTRENTCSNFIRENLRSNIINLHGEETFHLTKRYEKLRSKRGDLLCDLTFLLRCRDSKVLPTFTRLAYHTKSPKIDRILQNASRALLREEIHQVRKHLNNTDKELLELHLQLSNSVHPLLWNQLETVASWRADYNANLRRERQMKKYDALERKQHPQRSAPLDPKKVVHNISNYQLSETDTRVLGKGFNFAVAPRVVPNKEIISAVEASIQNVGEEDANIVRENVALLLRNSRPPAPNLSAEEHEALKKLRQNQDIMVLPADKGNATIVMNTTDYHQKVATLLENTAYKKINTDPTTYLEKTTRKKILASPIDPETKKHLVPRERSSRCPKFYGLPKIHKPDVPLRPIVSSIGSPVQNLARYLAQYIRANTDHPESYVRNSNHFVEILQSTEVQPTDLLVSFDIVSLFTSIPIEEALDIISQNNDFPSHIIELTAHCLHNTYFIYRGQRYRQLEGAPMGSPLSPIIADKFMEDFEKKALSTAPLKPTKWLRYVDDTFVIWPHGRTSLNNFLEHLNSIHPKIQFTMEIETDNKLPFLDVLVYKKRSGELGHTVYRKPTHTNRYLQATSHHHPAQRQGVIKTLVDRAKRIADTNSQPAELSQLRMVLQANGYTGNQINRAINNQQQPKRKDDPQPQQLAILPYVQGVTDKIGNLLRRLDIRPVFKPYQTISMMVNNPKDKIPLENHGVYSIPCKDCHKVYIGETSQKISARKEEHRRCLQNKVTTSSIYQHVHETQHRIDFDGTRQLANIEHHRTRKIREAIEIETRETFNRRDDSLNLPVPWKTCLRKRAGNRENIVNHPPREEGSVTAPNIRRRRNPVEHREEKPTTATAQCRYHLRSRVNRTPAEDGTHSGLDNGE